MPGGPVAWTRYVFRTVASVPLYLQVLITSVQLVVFLGAATSALAQVMVELPFWVATGAVWFSLGLGWLAWIYERVWFFATDARQRARATMRLGREALYSVNLFWRTLARIRAWQRKLWLPNYVAALWRRRGAVHISGRKNNAGLSGTGPGAGMVRDSARLMRVPLWSTDGASVLYLERVPSPGAR
ncbi:hypothetical protein F1559_003789 [Cyanidiococcus yangmingshanensis]|uniref:Uncharacterized protein n=1 Tax=Cyanidiococcus yangmingshanensis TaxID=2690220 RepID=A0A7J7IHY9_9RHOD|nr:hypothetical protein F1559_003789 [Cyanidiococcus yangmingshanensis]